MADIKIATGVEKININDKVTLEFNPTDAEIVEKIFDVFNGLEERQRKYQAEVEKNANKKKSLRLRVGKVTKCAIRSTAFSGFRFARLFSAL